MKKLLAVLLALVMLVSLAACAGNTDKDNPSSDAPANSDNPSMKANVNKKIAMIMQQGGLGDQGSVLSKKMPDFDLQRKVRSGC